MADKFYEQDNFQNLMRLYVNALVVSIQVILIVLTVWTVFSLGLHTYTIKRSVTMAKYVNGKKDLPVWMSSNTSQLREDVALEYLMMTTTSTGMIIVIPDEK